MGLTWHKPRYHKRFSSQTLPPLVVNGILLPMAHPKKSEKIIIKKRNIFYQEDFTQMMTSNLKAQEELRVEGINVADFFLRDFIFRRLYMKTSKLKTRTIKSLMEEGGRLHLEHGVLVPALRPQHGALLVEGGVALALHCEVLAAAVQQQADVQVAPHPWGGGGGGNRCL